MMCVRGVGIRVCVCVLPHKNTPLCNSKIIRSYTVQKCTIHTYPDIVVTYVHLNVACVFILLFFHIIH